MIMSKKNYIESLSRVLLIDIVEKIDSYSLKDLMRVKLRVLNQVANEPSVYQKFDFFNRNDPTALGMINQAADGGHIGASYVLAIISIFNGGESMREAIQMDWEFLVKQQTVATLVHPMCLP
uniref:At2g35280-like TPR domain-containing protein n=1 Tax=Solanum tuberosum TaxID=4113 RepID=M1BBC7_SOLTU